EFVRASIANVRDAILIGGLLAVVILLVFLRDWRLTFIAAMTLPLAVLITFLVMRLFGESINLMSMGGLAVAIGLVIDDAVVVGDYRTPPGTELEETDRLLKKIERVILATPVVASVQRRTGSELGLFATPQNSGDVLVRLKARSQRDRSSEEIISDLRDKLTAA